MISNFLKKRYVLPLAVFLGIYFDIFLLEDPSQYLYALLTILLILLICKERVGHILLFNMSMFFFLLVLLGLVFRFTIVSTEKFAIWFFIFAFAAVIRRLSVLRKEC